jgi:hypothetical protein
MLCPVMRTMLLASVLIFGVSTVIRAETRLFRNSDKTKSFSAELTAYDAKAKRVSVRLDNGRIQSFSIDVLSEEDQAYVLENANRLAVGNDLKVILKSYQGSPKKVEKDRISDRVYPSGYTITLSNRAKTAIENLTVKYTLYYAVQGYVKPDRKTEEKSATLVYKTIPPGGTVSQTTEPVDIVSGKLEPLFKDESVRGPDGKTYVERKLVEPGGRRKDQLVGCRVEILVDGKLVKTEGDGNLAHAELESPVVDPGRFPVTPAPGEKEKKD